MTFSEQIREARRIAQPTDYNGGPTDIPYRAISIFPSFFLARLGVTGNQITLFWVLLGLAGVLALGWPTYGVRVAGAILLEVSYLLDFVDGEVARLQNRTSKRGFLLDLVGHGVIKTSLFLAIGYQVFVTTQDPRNLLLAFSACVSLSSLYALPYLAGHAQVRNHAAAEGANPSAKRSTLRRLLGFGSLLFESPGIYAAVLVGAALDRIAWVLLLYGALGPLWLGLQAVKFRWE